MKMLDRKLLRDLWRSKGLLLAIAGILAVGVNNFIGLRSAYLNLENSKRDFYRECRLADFWIDVKKAPTAELDSLRAIPGIADLDARIQFRATVVLPDIEEPVNAVLLSLPDERSPMLNDIVMRSGSYFTGRRDDEGMPPGTDRFPRPRLRRRGRDEVAPEPIPGGRGEAVEGHRGRRRLRPRSPVGDGAAREGLPFQRQP